ncbi:MAG: hypothetical protein J5I90_12765, partial [Caldilineales bacterium]|nr:hypothetical protein [Caldilineales bacterium]
MDQVNPENDPDSIPVTDSAAASQRSPAAAPTGTQSTNADSKPGSRAGLVEVEAEYRFVEPATDVPGMDDLRLVLRLLVGAALVGGDELLARLRAWDANAETG